MCGLAKESQAEVDRRLKQLWSRLNALATQLEEMSNALEQFQRYSYQYNIKIIGLPETNMHDSASDTSAMCLNLLKWELKSLIAIDIAHRISTRNATSGPKKYL